MIDKRLEAVNSFPSLPDTQRKVAELDDLDDLDPPKKWAEAIDPDLPTKTVILEDSQQCALRIPVPRRNH